MCNDCLFYARCTRYDCTLIRRTREKDASRHPGLNMPLISIFCILGRKKRGESATDIEIQLYLPIFQSWDHFASNYNLLLGNKQFDRNNVLILCNIGKIVTIDTLKWILKCFEHFKHWQDYCVSRNCLALRILSLPRARVI